MEYKEFSAKTIEEAVTKALIDFGTTSDHIEYTVIEEGSSGLFGFFGKSSVIKARIKEESESDEIIFESDFKEIIEEKEKKQIRETEKKKGTEKKKNIENEQDIEEKVSIEKRNNEDGKESGIKEYFYSSMKENEWKNFLTSVFQAMDMDVTIESEFHEDTGTLDINMIGEDMGILIGKRGQTLDSLQYLVSLVINKKSDTYIRVKLDTENYRERRKETLESLAKNIAVKVKKTKRPVSLEPMNPYERRIIHAALQNDKYVLTRSEGEEPYRHVVVFLKKEKNHKS